MPVPDDLTLSLSLSLSFSLSLSLPLFFSLYLSLPSTSSMAFGLDYMCVLQVNRAAKKCVSDVKKHSDPISLEAANRAF
jgi:hypothetical protein